MKPIDILQELKQHKIKDLSYYKPVYVVPWAMYVHLDGTVVINVDYSYRKESGGTESMEIELTREGAIVNIRDCGNYRWDCDPADWCEEPFPVSEILR